jgi:Leucine-rich repeat (LRR) protein
LSTIPSTIQNLTLLNTLHINNNYIDAFPKSILALKELEDLNISNNFMTDLSLELQKLDKLQLLLVSENMDKTSEKYTPFAEMFEVLRSRGAIVRE